MAVDPSDFPDEWKRQQPSPTAPAPATPIDPSTITPVDPTAPGMAQPSDAGRAARGETVTGDVPVTGGIWSDVESAFAKPTLGLAGGTGQLYGDVTGTTPQWAQTASSAALSPNRTWAGTAAEIAGWAPAIYASRFLGPFAAPVLGGLYATPSGSVPSHLVGAGVSAVGDQLLRLPFLQRWGFGRMAAENARRQANTREFINRLDEWDNYNSRFDNYMQQVQAKGQAPQQAVRTWVENAFSGIPGAPLRAGDIGGDEVAELSEWSGKKIGQLNSKMDWHPSDATISDMRAKSGIISQSIGEAMRGRWNELFNDHVLADITSDVKTSAGTPTGRIPTRVTGERFAGYVQRLRGLADDEWRAARSDPTNFRDRRKIAMGLRAFADYAEDQATGPNKPLRDQMRRARAMMGTLGRAMNEDVATPRSIRAQRGRELGGREALQAATRRDPLLQEMRRLRNVHESKPAAPEQPPIPRAYRPEHERADHLTAAAGAHAAHHLTGIPAWLMYHGMRDQLGRNRLANIVAAWARGGSRVPPGTAGPLGAYSSRFYDQGPTGGVAP